MNVDRATVERRWRERGFSCGLWVDPPGEVWSDFAHDTDELVMIVEGNVEFEIDGKANRPLPGEEILIPARARHTVRNLGAASRAGSKLPAMTTIYGAGIHQPRHAAEHLVALARHTEPTS
jgi:quercetin dioxygenase-like cupin family protein